MKIVVFGGLGYIGSHVVRQLLNKGHFVRIVDNCRTGIEQSLPEGVQFSLGDIRYDRDCDEGWVNMDACILLSGIVGLPDTSKNPILTEAVNVRGIRNVAIRAKGRPIIYSGTGSSYGVVENELCDENTPCNPCSLYGFSKLEGEKIVLNESGGLATRFATLMGTSHCMRWNLLPNEFVKKALDFGHLDIFQPEARRTFLHVKDAASSLIFLLENHKTLKHKVYNVGDQEGGNLSKRELCELIRLKTGCTVNYNMKGSDPDARDYFFSTQRINDAGWQSNISIDDSLDELINYYKG